ncbi:MAG: bifunctional riboflavin kinase/FAD synthetase [Thermoanaerobacterales bacterium]|nr:bifunctional riboflavin kinase/FAD synthetase [Bacillota bacterium]MDI6906245.1 bifunctional riboflavin kinase/FAD synthetase [Thermoanaerobacterales bacterium]
MNVYTRFQSLKAHYPHLMLGLGNFDGVHAGHQALIRALVQRCRVTGSVPGIFTFHPHPVAVLRPKDAPLLLLSPGTKQELMSRMGIDVFLSIPFDLEFARMQPEEFVRLVLVDELGVDGVFVGYNYTFGHRGAGDPPLLESLGMVMGFEVCVIPPVTIEGQVVSSTLIRRLLSEGKVRQAARYLGYEPFIEGTVVGGDQRGRGLLGFPTANIEMPAGLVVPPDGVYAVRVLIGGETFLGVANIGLRPTFKGQNKTRNIEVHVFDFAGDLYGESIRVLFRDRLRGERKFASPEELSRQIEADIMRARAVHAE